MPEGTPAVAGDATLDGWPDVTPDAPPEPGPAAAPETVDAEGPLAEIFGETFTTRLGFAGPWSSSPLDDLSEASSPSSASRLLGGGSGVLFRRCETRLIAFLAAR